MNKENDRTCAQRYVSVAQHKYCYCYHYRSHSHILWICVAMAKCCRNCVHIFLSAEMLLLFAVSWHSDNLRRIKNRLLPLTAWTAPNITGGIGMYVDHCHIYRRKEIFMELIFDNNDRKFQNRIRNQVIRASYHTHKHTHTRIRGKRKWFERTNKFRLNAVDCAMCVAHRLKMNERLGRTVRWIAFFAPLVMSDLYHNHSICGGAFWALTSSEADNVPIKR